MLVPSGGCCSDHCVTVNTVRVVNVYRGNKTCGVSAAYVDIFALYTFYVVEFSSPGSGVEEEAKRTQNATPFNIYQL